MQKTELSQTLARFTGVNSSLSRRIQHFLSLFLLLALVLGPEAFAREVLLSLDEANRVQLLIDYSASRVRRWEIRSEHSTPQLVDTLGRVLTVNLNRNMLAVKVDDDTLYNFNIQSAARIRPVPERLLTEIELRLVGNGLATAFHLPSPRIQAANKLDYPLLVDLHTHYMGELSSIEMLKIAEKWRAPYPVALLQELGIDTSGFERVDPATVILGSHKMTVDERRYFTRALSMEAGEIGSFLDLENAYRFRDPLAKNRRLVPAILGGIARAYAQIGTRYAELSISARFISGPGFLASLGPVLRGIEESTGVHLRFLASFQRSKSLSELEKLSDEVMTIADDYNLAGIDFVGEEKNSVADFSSIIRRFRKFKDERRPHFQIRVHAGESPAFPDNVHLAVMAGATRIGHGVYGVNASTMTLIKERNILVEINFDSNIALNYVGQAARVVHLVHNYIQSGVQTALGSDGSGVLSTNLISEMHSLIRAGLSANDVAALSSFSQNYYHKINTHRPSVCAHLVLAPGPK